MSESNKKKRKKIFPSTFSMKINELLPSGEGIGYYADRPVRTVGVLPDEEVEVFPTKVSRTGSKAIVNQVLTPSPHRLEPKDSHYQSTSPFQIIPYDMELELKIGFAKRIFEEKAGSLPQKNVTIEPAENPWHYRNKMEFSFTEVDGIISLAFNRRFSYKVKIPLESSSICHSQINVCAKKIVEVINERNIPLAELKTLILRYSYEENKTIAILYVTNPDIECFEIIHPDLKGWMIAYSDPKSPASTTSKVLLKKGDLFLIESILDVRLKYFYSGFFQASPPMFNQLSHYLLQNITPGGNLVDLFSGVGTIGLILSSKFEKVISVEMDDAAKEAAKWNLKENKIKNIELYSGKAEKQNLIEILGRADTLIIDPPRAGCHPKVVKAILETRPKQFIYVSCNPKTQANEFKLLKEYYQVKDWKLFDLYPKTPHMESVIIMTRNQ